jgi:hypothetical protein
MQTGRGVKLATGLMHALSRAEDRSTVQHKDHVALVWVCLVMSALVKDCHSSKYSRGENNDMGIYQFNIQQMTAASWTSVGIWTSCDGFHPWCGLLSGYLA